MSSPAAHSEYSASGFEAAMLCPGKRVMERGLPDSSSKYADEGTAAHALFSDLIDGKTPATHYEVAGTLWEVTDEMRSAVETAVVEVRRIARGGMVLSETRVNYSAALGVAHDEAWGTADIIAAVDNELQVHDYKHGRGVEVFAEENPQMMLYALGALVPAQGVLGDFDTVRMVIHQPRIKNEPSEWVCTLDQLEGWAQTVAQPAVSVRKMAARLPDGVALQAFLHPNEKSCRFCRAKATCPALRADAARTVFEIVPASPDEFDRLAPAETAKQSPNAWLAKVLGKADMIEDYLKAVRAEVERRLLEGQVVEGYKIVQGKRGNRAWRPDDELPAALFDRLGNAAYKPRELISPTDAEKALGKSAFKALAGHVTQADGKPHVAPASDKRAALSFSPVADEFDIVSTHA